MFVIEQILPLECLKFRLVSYSMALSQEMPLWIPKWKKPTGMPLPKPKIGDVNVVPLVVHIHPTILATSVG